MSGFGLWMGGVALLTAKFLMVFGLWAKQPHAGPSLAEVGATGLPLVAYVTVDRTDGLDRRMLARP